MTLLEKLKREIPVSEDPASVIPLKRIARTAKSGGKSKGNDAYLTPQNFLDVLYALGRVGLDPAGSQLGSLLHPDREYRLDRGEDALALPWRSPLGSIVYCNPPYSATRKWIEKADAEHRAHGSEIVLLVAARTDTIAMQAAQANCVCFWKGRFIFLDPVTRHPPVDVKGKSTGAMFPSAILYYGLRESRFREVFSPHGKVVTWANPPARLTPPNT